MRLAGTLNGIETIIAIRKEFPRKPVVSIPFKTVTNTLERFVKREY
ncbi:hypothetical protein LEP1GSC188_0643 [Leptospira weilii serovar Topaz str. LT2116]|uniref:Uncharacterized protein n=1 Tax=Leptospira weilii serovar Topaz str. LT2116 TaxID=1088540 RepID=M3H198_9LEPT|nr:hypothetical protein LEP1GSC188_0643 [Leptospira weilii serovar Topaz str. LT2116]